MPREDGNGEHDARHHRAGQLVEDQQFTAARGDGESVVAELGVEVVGAQAGSVDDPPAADVAGGGDQGGVVGGLGAGQHVGDGRAAAQLDAALDGVGGQREVGGPGADDGFAGHGESGQGAGAEFGDAAVHLVGVDDFAGLVAVALSLVLQVRQGVDFLIGPGDEQRAGPLDGNAGLLGVVPEKVVAAGDEPGFQGAGGGVVAGVQQRGVGLAGAVTDVVSGVDEGHGQAGAGQVAGDRGSDDAGADDDDIADVRGGGGHGCVSLGASAAVAACFHRCRCSAARSADHRGS